MLRAARIGMLTKDSLRFSTILGSTAIRRSHSNTSSTQASVGCDTPRTWCRLKDNPFAGVKRPTQPKARDRLASDAKTAVILNPLGYDPDTAPITSTARVSATMVFAIETGMRANEILRLRWSDIVGAVTTVRDGKTAAVRGASRFPRAPLPYWADCRATMHAPASTCHAPPGDHATGEETADP
ncbi:MAG: hypothetical protein HKL99_14610 [Burkholderiales bacterium]|jgi:integrase|nr:hypothetical protein [Burkholderiales bacterium]